MTPNHTTHDMKTLQNIYHTGDINLAASLHAIGIPPVAKPARIKAMRGDYLSFALGACTQDGKMTTDEAMAAWDNPETFITKNPEHPLSYIMAFLANLSNLRSFVHGPADDLTVLEKGKSVLVLNPADPRHIQDKLLRRMKI